MQFSLSARAILFLLCKYEPPSPAHVVAAPDVHQALGVLVVQGVGVVEQEHGARAAVEHGLAGNQGRTCTRDRVAIYALARMGNCNQKMCIPRILYKNETINAPKYVIRHMQNTQAAYLAACPYAIQVIPLSPPSLNRATNSCSPWHASTLPITGPRPRLPCLWYLNPCPLSPAPELCAVATYSGPT